MPGELDTCVRERKNSQRILKNERNEVSIYEIEKKFEMESYFGVRWISQNLCLEVRFKMLIKHSSGDVVQDTCIWSSRRKCKLQVYTGISSRHSFSIQEMGLNHQGCEYR